MLIKTILPLLVAASGFVTAAELPLFFLPNVEQPHSPIRFIAETSHLQAGFAAGFVTFRASGIHLHLRFVGANDRATIDGVDPLAAKASFLKGNSPTKWHSSVPIYPKVLYRGLYPGIDMTYAGEGARIKSEFRVAPGANPSQIQLEYEAAGSVSISENGDLVVSTGSGELREQAPAIYQNSGRERVHVEGGYRMLGPRTVGFEIRGYDPSQPLIIDPVVSYSSYLGGSEMSAVTGVAVDSVGDLYATGWTEALDFPIDGAIQVSNQGGVDAFVVKMNPAGTALMYATYIGGRGDDRGAGIAVDSSGQAYVTGSTSSDNFPLASPIRSTLTGGRAAFALKLNAAGSALLYSTYLGGSNYDLGNAIAVDGSGNAYIAGDTLSVDFPVVNAFQRVSAGNMDAFITKFNPTGGIILSTFLGGAGNDHAGGIAVDASGNIYVAGGTSSLNFPVLNAIQNQNAGGQDAFATKLSASGSTLLYSTYLGGAGGSPAAPEEGNSIVVDSGGNAYVAGVTNSVNFPVTAGALRTTYNGLQDAFAVKINATGNALIYGTYVGGSRFNWISGIAVDSSGDAYLSGYTSSFDFPMVGGLQAAFNGYYDAFISELNGAGSALTFSTLWGGTRADEANAIALAPNGSILTGGQTNSVDFPLVAPFQSVNSASSTGWVMRIGSASASSGAAQFVTLDTATQGNWKGVYGADGYNVINNAISYPAYVTPVPTGNSSYTWPATTDVRALQQANSGSRIAAVWYAASSFTIDLPFSGTQVYQMAVYCLDFDNEGRAQRLDILDTNNNVLDSRSLTDMSGGVWVVWNLSGHVQLRLTGTAGPNAVLNGLFFSTSASPTATAQFIKLDSTTQGTWKGVYGADGYNVINNAISYPAYVTPVPTGNSSYTWPATTDVRALQQANSGSRIAAVWYAASSFTIDLPFSGTQVYQMAVYCLDFDNEGRAQRLDILDTNNNVLDSRSLTDMSGGVWVVWNLSGHVQLRLTGTAGPNAVLNGLFFSTSASPTATAQFIKLDSTTQGTWKGVYGADGYNVINNAISYPAYVTPVPTGNSSYTWPATTDVRALQQANSGSRIAAVWYAASSFTIDLPFSGAQVYQMAVYCLDFDNEGRAQRLDILDTNNNVLDSRSLTNISGGVWVVWNLSGHVQLRLTGTAGPNAVVNGLFFGL